MRAVTAQEGAVTVADRPDPTPGAGEILVRVRAAGLNGADMLQARGLYPPPPGIPADIPGLEFAGEVVACGEGAARFHPGDRVMGLLGGAAQAELVTLHERVAMPVPEATGWAAAGGFPEVFSTAHDALVSQCGLRPGERLLVQGAAGGVGTAAIQIAALTGALPVASTRHPRHDAALRELGAVETLRPEEVAAHGPYDAVIELVGAPNLEVDLDSLAPGGRIVVIGVQAGARSQIDLRGLMGRRARLMGSTLRSRPLEEKAAVARRVEAELMPALAAGRLRVVVEAEVPLEEAAAAYQRFQAGGKLGKIVLTLS